MVHRNERSAIELPSLTPEIIQRAAELVMHHHVFKEPAGSRATFASAERRAPYDLSVALYDILDSEGKPTLLSDFAKLRYELEEALKDNKPVQAALRHNYASADRLNRQARRRES